MRMMRRALALLLVVLLMAAALPTALASAQGDEEVAGKKATVYFTYKNIYNLTGDFSYSDPDGVVEEAYVVVSNDGGLNDSVQSSNGSWKNSVWMEPFGDPAPTTVKIALVVKLKSTAQAGSTVTVTFSGSYGDANKGIGDDTSFSETATITVKEKPASTPTEPPEPTQPPVRIDYSDLENAIALANGLEKSDYTAASWATLMDALAAGNAALTSKSQTVVDQASQALADAVASLVLMDYSELLASLASVDTLVQNNELADLWLQLVEKVAEGNALLDSGDQEAVDACAQEINSLLQKIGEAMDKLIKTETIQVEVPVEVLPTEDYCNIPLHKFWPIAFFVSLAVNVVTIGAIVLMISIRRRNRRDDTPLVDYDIDDDI